MNDLYDVLLDHAADSDLEVIFFHSGNLVLGLYLDAWDGRTFTLTFPDVYRVDITPWICSLGQIQFGDLHLIPDEYLARHWSGLNGEDNLRVAKITSDDESHFFVVYSGQEVFEEVAHDDPILRGTWILKFNLNAKI